MSDKSPYGELANLALRFTQASATVVIVIDGNQGTGFSVIAREGFAFDIAKVLRDAADKLDAAKKQAN